MIRIKRRGREDGKIKGRKGAAVRKQREKGGRKKDDRKEKACNSISCR